MSRLDWDCFSTWVSLDIRVSLASPTISLQILHTCKQSSCRWSRVSYWWNLDLIVVLRNRLFLPYSFDAVLHSRALTGLEKAEIKRWKENPLVVPGVGWHTSRKVPRCTWSYQGPLRPGPKGPAVIRASWIKLLDNRIILEISSSEFEIQNDFDLMQGSFFVWTID